MGGLSRGKHESECGVACTAGKVVKAVRGVFTEKPEPYKETREKDPTTEQLRRRPGQLEETIKAQTE